MLMKTTIPLFLLIAVSAVPASSQKVINEKTIRTRDCGSSDDLLSEIKLPKEGEIKNFSLNSIRKTKTGFAVSVDWGASMTHYYIRFDFRCMQNHFYLYRVEKVSFLTEHPERGYWDKKVTRVTRIRNLPIEKFVITRYL